MFNRATDKIAKYLARKSKPFFYGDRELTEKGQAQFECRSIIYTYMAFAFPFWVFVNFFFE